MKPDHLIDLILGYRKAKVLMVAASLDCFTLLSRAMSAREAARRLKIDERAAEIVFDALAAMGFLAKRGQRYGNTALSERFLVRGMPDFIGNNLKYQEILWDAWSELGESVRRGGAVRPLEHWLFAQKGFVNEYIMGMDNIARRPSQEIARAVPARGAKSLLDVGAGPGTYSRAFLARNPALFATLLDLPVTLKVTRRLFRQDSRYRGRVRLVPGDYRRASFGTDRHDMILMSHITHDESPEVNRGLAAKCFKALRPGGRVVIHDFMVENNRIKPEFGALFSVHMLAYTKAGRTYTAAEYRGWLRQAGFRRFEERCVAADARNASRIIVASKGRG